MANLALTSPLAPVVAAVEGLRRHHPDRLRCIKTGLIVENPETWLKKRPDPAAVAVLIVAGWTGARRVPLLDDNHTFVNHLGQFGITTARVAVLADDPVADAPGVVVAKDREDLLRIVLQYAGAAPDIIRTLSPHHQQRDLHLRRGA